MRTVAVIQKQIETTRDRLQAELEKLQAEIDDKLRAERHKTLSMIADAVQQHRFSWSEISQAVKELSRDRDEKLVSVNAPKKPRDYTRADGDPDKAIRGALYGTGDGRVWPGHAKKPKWFVEALAGRPVSALLLDASGAVRGSPMGTKLTTKVLNGKVIAKTAPKRKQQSKKKVGHKVYYVGKQEWVQKGGFPPMWLKKHMESVGATLADIPFRREGAE